MSTVVISQPMLFPWPGFFELVALADIYVHLDDVQFSRGSFVNRIQIKHPSGTKWMTIPLSDKGSFQTILELKPCGTDWKQRHYALVAQSLRGAPYIDCALDLFNRVYEAEENLVELLMSSVTTPANLIGFDRPISWLRASELKIAATGFERVLEIVKALGGTRYITGHGAANYLQHEVFEKAGIEVLYVKYSLTPYQQLHGPFTPFVSVLDLVANVGAQARSKLQPSTVPWRDFVSYKEYFAPKRSITRDE